NKISKEQKIYELSVIWKELSYNFANMDNCHGLDIDSLYQMYIPIVQNTKNDWEYCKVIQRFLAHFNSGHTDIYDIPPYLIPYLARPYIQTTYNNGKIIIENVGEFQTENIQIGDEIVTINGQDALAYFQKFYVPYICTTNEEDKIHKAMFNVGPAHLLPKGTKITLGIKTEKGIKKVNIYANKGLKGLGNTGSSKQENWRIHSLTSSDKNYFAIDTLINFAYIRLTACNQDFQDYFAEKYPLISTVNNLIIDISKNKGGSNNFTNSALNLLVDQDTIYSYMMQGKVHNAFGKGYIALVLRMMPDFDIEKYSSEQISAIKYYKGNAFEDIRHFNNFRDYKNLIDSQNRYKGKIYVIIGRNTLSAGEGFAIQLSQSNNTVLLGAKTAGALGNIYPIHLPSGLVIIMNVVKTYDYQGNDISSGLSPDYEYDFSEFYQTENPNEMLNKFVKIIKKLETTR
ncbi:MAG: hypothetical protein LBE13_14265, partial [Bacteroidales bacterium]|nr:hypothetical protein [Bacteroidales bacterium]